MPSNEFKKKRFQTLVEMNHFPEPASLEAAETRKAFLHEQIRFSGERLATKTAADFQDYAAFSSWRRRTNTFMDMSKFEIGYLNRFIAVHKAEAQYGKGALNFFGPTAQRSA